MPTRITLLALAALLAACSGTRTAEPAPTPAPQTHAQQPSTHWARTAAEHRAIFLQTFRLAEWRIERQAVSLERGGWAVIMDADETALDNSEYQRRINIAGAPFDNESWNTWVREQSAPALPGAAAFATRVRELGGRMIIVTNRDDVVCPETRANLTAAGVVHDLVLCMQPGVSDKNLRFRAVEQGTASPELGPLRVIMFVGDNIRDFPDGTQALRDAPESALSKVGVSWIVLPNPMYGSWERNPPR